MASKVVFHRGRDRIRDRDRVKCVKMLYCSLVLILLLLLAFSKVQDATNYDARPTSPQLSQQQALQRFDSTLDQFVFHSNFSLPDLVTLSALYFLREDQYKQGGESQSLHYTQLALKELYDLCNSWTTHPSTISLGHPCDQEFEFQTLWEALRVHEIRMMILLGKYANALSSAHSQLTNHIFRFGLLPVEEDLSRNIFELPNLQISNFPWSHFTLNQPSSDTATAASSAFYVLSNSDAENEVHYNTTSLLTLREQRARLYNTLGEVFLTRGDAIQSVPYFVRVIQLAPCMHHAYFQLARALQSSIFPEDDYIESLSKVEKSHISLNETNVAFADNIDKSYERSLWEEEKKQLSELLQQRTETLLGGVTVVSNSDLGDDSSTDASTSSTSYQIIYSPLSVAREKINNPDRTNSNTCVFGDELVYLEVLLKYGNLGPWQYAAHASSLVIRSALYWTLFHTAETLKDYDLAWFYLQQGRALERKRIYQLSKIASTKQPQTNIENDNADRSKDYIEDGPQNPSNRDAQGPVVMPTETEYWANYRQQSQQLAFQVTRLYPPYFWPPADYDSLLTNKQISGANNPNSTKAIVPIESMQSTVNSSIPIFIVGFFRSGSTLLESLLETHPNVYALGERSPFAQSVAINLQPLAKQRWKLLQDYLQQFDRKSTDKNGKATKSDRKNSKQWSKKEKRLWQMEMNLIDKHFQVHGFNIIQQMQNWTNTLYNKSIFDVNAQLNSSTTASSSIDRIVDKMLTNYRHIGLIHYLFPQAVILHTMRDPVDTLLSCLRHRFADDHSAYTLDMESLVEEYIAYLMVVQHFRRVLPWRDYPMRTNDVSFKEKSSNYERDLEKEERVVRQGVVDIRYEMLVAEPLLYFQDILRLLRLPPSSFNETNIRGFYSLQDHAQERHIKTASFLQVRQPISAHLVGQWRRYAKALLPTLLAVLEDKIQVLREHAGLLPYFSVVDMTSYSGEKKKNTKNKHQVDGASLDMNWMLSPEFNYSLHMDMLKDFVQKQRGMGISSRNRKDLGI